MGLKPLMSPSLPYACDWLAAPRGQVHPWDIKARCVWLRALRMQTNGMQIRARMQAAPVRDGGTYALVLVAQMQLHEF